jgi:hypothetical protein
MAKKIITLFATVAVVLPIGVHIRNVSENDSLLQILFPMFGLLAFTLLWLHAMSGVFEEWLREQFDFEAFVRWTSLVILISILLHPLLLLILVNFDLKTIFGDGHWAVWLGLAGLILLLTYDVGKALKRYEFFTRNWNKILIVSNIGFILTFFHSFELGSDLQSGFMRGLWIFYGVTAIAAIIYTYGFKRRGLGLDLRQKQR